MAAHAQPPEVSYGPVSPKHPRTHYPLVAALLILMGVAVGAICCCCYRWEGQMRVQARPRSAAQSDATDGAEASPNSRPNSAEFCNPHPRVSSVSVLMPGDDIPRFIAWTVPRGAPAAADAPKALPPASAQAEKSVPSSVAPLALWTPGRASG